MDNKTIIELSEKYKDYVIQCRRTIHQFAEVSRNEYKTAEFIRKELDQMGIPYKKLVETGTVGIIDTGKPGPIIALRADIDALPMPENPNNLKGPRNCVSQDPNTCHACGHDAHTAMLLGTSKALMEQKDTLAGKILLCFEQGEEDGSGSKAMHDELDQFAIDYCWAIHVYAGLESGKICLDPGPRMAGAAACTLTFTGKGGHGSRPDLSINPVFCAANFYNNAAVAFANQIDANQTVTLGLTSIQGGSVGNIIPDTAKVLGSLRFFSNEEGKKAVEIVREVAEHTAAMNHCTVDTSGCFFAIGPVVNDEHVATVAKEKISEVLPEGCVSPCDPWFASEDFCRYCDKWPSMMAHLGILNPEYGSGAAHHNEYFDVDENVLSIGTKSTLRFVTAMIEDYSHNS